MLVGKRILGEFDENVWQLNPFICGQELALERGDAQNPSVCQDIFHAYPAIL
jgi:hypothetical protein